MDGNLSVADVAAVAGNKGRDGFCDDGMWMFALLILLFGGGFSGYGNGGERVATQADIQRAVDFDTLKSSIANGTASTISAIKDSSYNNLSEMRDLGIQTQAGFTNMQNCCCELKSAILENRYLAAQNTAELASKIDRDKIETLQSQVNQLQLNQALCGVPKTNPYLYNVVAPCGNGCCNI